MVNSGQKAKFPTAGLWAGDDEGHQEASIGVLYILWMQIMEWLQKNYQFQHVKSNVVYRRLPDMVGN
jgi:hypothetical protein